MSTTSSDDELLLSRLRELSLVELDVLLCGSTGEHAAELLAAYAEDLGGALAAARERARELREMVASGPDPLALLDAPFEIRARDGGKDALERAVRRLGARAQACRALARIDEVTARLVPRLLEADRRRAASSIR